MSKRGDRGRWAGDAARAEVLDRAPPGRAARLVWEQVGLPRVLQRAGVEVHHGPHYTMPGRAPAPKVVTIHDTTFLDHPEWHQRGKVRFFRRALRAAATRADALICVSRFTAGRLEDLLDVRAPVHVIPHGVDHDRYRPQERPSAPNSPYVAFVGTLEPRKDLPTLVQAFDKLARARSDLLLLLAGVAGWGSGVDEAVAASAYRHRIKRLGYLPEDEVPAFLAGAAAVAYPSLAEGFGLPALEALACGAPLVTTTGSAMEEVVGDAAVLVRPGDAGALADALATVLDGGPEVEARRRRGLAVAARYTWDATAEAHVGVYRSVL